MFPSQIVESQIEENIHNKEKFIIATSNFIEIWDKHIKRRAIENIKETAYLVKTNTLIY